MVLREERTPLSVTLQDSYTFDEVQLGDSYGGRELLWEHGLG